MPRLIEMGDLIRRCQQRADKVGDDHIGGDDTAEWHSLISEVYGADVYCVVAESAGRYFEYKSTLTTTGVAYVDEPADCLALMGLDYVDSAGRHYPLQPLEVQEEAFYVGASSGSRALYYTLVDDRIYLYPLPPTGQTYEIQYVPQPPDLATFDSDDCVDVVTPAGEACLIWGVAALALAKAKQDASFHTQQHEKYRERHNEWAVSRMLTEPHRQVVRLQDIGRIGYPISPADWRFR